MSGKGNCFDNSAVESVFKSLKAELIWQNTWQTGLGFEVTGFEVINGFYNPRRRDSVLGWKSPVAFEKFAACHQQQPGIETVQAQSVMVRIARRTDQRAKWAQNLLVRANDNKTLVTIASKTVRIVWAVHFRLRAASAVAFRRAAVRRTFSSS